MPNTKGVLSSILIGIETNWGDGTADTYAKFISDSMVENISPVYLNTLQEEAAQTASEKGLIAASGDVVLLGDYYNGINKLLEAAIGSVTTGVYSLTTDLNKSIGIKIDKAFSYLGTGAGLKVNTLKISGDAKENKLLFTGSLVGKSYVLSSGSNTPSFANESTILMSQLTARLGDKVNALASIDEITVSKFELTLDNNLKADDAVGGSYNILEPERNGFRKVTLSLTLPRLSANTYDGYRSGRTLLQSDFIFTDGTKTFKLEFPELILVEGGQAPISGPEIISPTLVFDCYKNSSLTIMASVEKEFEATLT